MSSSEDLIKIVYIMDVNDSYDIADSDAEQAGAPFPPERDQVDAEAVQENLTVITQYFASTFVSTLQKPKVLVVERVQEVIQEKFILLKEVGMTRTRF